ncbi:MAG: thioredoxin domain-containing protein [Terrimesophilobacter sp.]
MNRRTLIILLAAAVLVVGSVVGYALTRSMPENAGNVSQSGQDSTPSSDGQPSASTGSGTYVDYSPTAIADASGTTLLFFHAPWCPSCRQIESEITSNGVPDGVTIIKVDYDSNQDLRQKYGVTIQTTFVKVDASGNELEKFVPYGGDLGLKLVIDALA